MCAHTLCQSIASKAVLSGYRQRTESNTSLLASYNQYPQGCSKLGGGRGHLLYPAAPAGHRMLLLNPLLRGVCTSQRPYLATSAAPLFRTAARCVCTSEPISAAAATSQHKQMGWPWPFRNSSSSGSGSGSSKLQQLLEVARLFSHQPSAEALQDVKAALREVPLRELGLHEAAIGGPAAVRSQHAISYQHIFEDKDVSMGIFAMHRGATLPLHDHPGMHVLSRVLYGHLHVIGYDWVDRQQHTAQLAADSNLTADQIAVLGPDYGGNMHCLTATTDVAILDVLAPAYDPKGGRDCTYYAVVQDAPMQLKETQPSDDFNVITVPYRGLRPQG